MTPTPRTAAVLALCVLSAAATAQHGPGFGPGFDTGFDTARATDPAIEAPVTDDDAFTRPIAQIPPPEPEPRPSESDIPLGAREISDVLPTLQAGREAPTETIPEPASRSGVSDIARTVAALMLVIAIILALAWGVRRIARSQGGLTARLTAGGKAPSGILEVLGRYPVAGKLTLVVLRFDRRVLLVAQSHNAGGAMQTLCELSDPTDVASVLSRVSESDAVNTAFREAIAHAERDVATALAPETHVPLDRFDPGVREVSQTLDGDRLELLRDAPPEPAPEISPLRRRLDAMRAGVGV